MKKCFFGLFLILMFPWSPALASFSGPYIVYTLEVLDPGDGGDGSYASVPDDLYLYPHVYSENMPGSPAGVLGVVLDQLRSFKPKLYKGTEITRTVPDDTFPIRSVTLVTAVRTEHDFKTLMAEVVYSFEFYDFESRGPITIDFHFKDPKLEKKYGGKKFSKKDVGFPAFVLKPFPK